ncbi:MAG: hypothetical protein ACLU9S_11840 [Oscillospiraceae bacterium]
MEKGAQVTVTVRQYHARRRRGEVLAWSLAAISITGASTGVCPNVTWW